jgi:hypothetical protein
MNFTLVPEERRITGDSVPWTADRGYEITFKCQPRRTSILKFSDLGFQSESTIKSLEAPKLLE